MPISTPDGKSNAAPPGQSKYYTNYMTPHTSGVVPGVITTGAPAPGTMPPGQGGYFPQGEGGGGGTPPPGTTFGTVGGALEGGEPDPYIQGGTPWVEQAQSYYQEPVESQAFESFADGQSINDMEIALADQYDKMLAQQMGQHSSQQQAAEDMLRAQAMQMGVGGSPGGALSDWAGVQSEGARSRASIKLAHENERANAENAMRDEYTRLSNAEKTQVTQAKAAYQQYFIDTRRSEAIGPRGDNLNPRFQDDLTSLYELLSHNNVPQSVAEDMIDELTSQWKDSGLASFYTDNSGRTVYPGLDIKFGAKNAYLKTDSWVMDKLKSQDPTFDGWLTPGMNVDSTWFGNTAHLGSGRGFWEGWQGQMFTLGSDIEIYPTDGGQDAQYWAGNY